MNLVRWCCRVHAFFPVVHKTGRIFCVQSSSACTQKSTRTCEQNNICLHIYCMCSVQPHIECSEYLTCFGSSKQKHYTTGSDYWLRTQDGPCWCYYGRWCFYCQCTVCRWFCYCCCCRCHSRRHFTVRNSKYTHTRIYACTPSGGTPWLEHT